MELVNTESNKLVDLRVLLKALRAFQNAGEEGLTRERLGVVLGVGVKTADRARDLLCKQGATITKVGTAKPYRFSMATPPNWLPQISTSVRLGLWAGMQVLSASGAPLLADRLSVLEPPSDQTMAKEDQATFDALDGMVQISGGVSPDPTEAQAELLESLLKALSQAPMRQFEVVTQGSHRNARACRVSPYRLVHDLTVSATFLVAWDMATCEPVLINLSHIESLEVTESPVHYPSHDLFHPPLQILKTATQHLSGGKISASDPFQVVIRIHDRDVFDQLVEIPPSFPSLRLDRPHGNRPAEMTFTATHAEGVIRWVLPYGADLEVVQPDELRRSVKDAVLAVASRY